MDLPASLSPSSKETPCSPPLILTPILAEVFDQILGLNGLQFSSLSQPTCLAEFKQIKSIRCLPLEEGQAVLQLGIEGAPQVSISGGPGSSVGEIYSIQPIQVQQGLEILC